MSVTVRPPRQSPVSVVPRAVAKRDGSGGLRRRLAGRLASSPGRLSVLMAVLLTLGLLAGLAAVVGVVQRGGDLDGVRARSGPLTVAAQDLYRSLSDADATAAAAFLSIGAEPADLRDRYLRDIVAAGQALAVAGRIAEEQTASLAQISRDLPIYTGLVETARGYNRQNLPVGSAYLREASTLMREQILRAARDFYKASTGRLADERSAAGGLPWLALGLIILTLVGLFWGQRYLSRRTRRTFNVGLVSATAAGLVLLLWLGLSWIGSASHLHAANRNGASQVDLLSQIRIAALQARADEALTLVAHGSGGEFEDDFATSMTTLGGGGKSGLIGRARAQANDSRVSGALSEVDNLVQQWRESHQKVRDLDNSGQTPEAVKLAIGADPAGTATLFNAIDQKLATAIDVASTAFDSQARQAAGSLSGAGLGLGVFTLVLLVGVSAGLVQRIAEYR